MHQPLVLCTRHRHPWPRVLRPPTVCSSPPPGSPPPAGSRASSPARPTNYHRESLSSNADCAELKREDELHKPDQATSKVGAPPRPVRLQHGIKNDAPVHSALPSHRWRPSELPPASGSTDDAPSTNPVLSRSGPFPAAHPRSVHQLEMASSRGHQTRPHPVRGIHHQNLFLLTRVGRAKHNAFLQLSLCEADEDAGSMVIDPLYED